MSEATHRLLAERTVSEMDVCKYLIVYPFLAFTFFQVAACSDVSIVGGKDVKKLKSWMVSIQNNEWHVCGGILIQKQWVLTAAHCKRELSSSVTVLIGSLSLSTLSKGSQRVGILSYSYPNTYNLNTKQDDIMLIKVTVVDRELCNRYYNRKPVITEDMMCAGSMEKNRGACWGDSGGPLECKKNLVGVLSGSDECGNPKKPTVYTFLSKRHITWINSVLKKESNSTAF